MYNADPYLRSDYLIFGQGEPFRLTPWTLPALPSSTRRGPGSLGPQSILGSFRGLPAPGPRGPWEPWLL